MSGTDLADLVTAAQRGDAMAMQELLGLLTPYVGRLCGPIALQEGQDATQEALIAIFRNLGQLTEPAAVFGWARAIAVRAAIRVASAARRNVAVPLEDVPSAGDPLLASDIRDVLDRLSPEHRAVLVLRDLEGLDEHTVGMVLAVPEGTVKSRLFRARTSFRKAWAR